MNPLTGRTAEQEWVDTRRDFTRFYELERISVLREADSPVISTPPGVDFVEYLPSDVTDVKVGTFDCIDTLNTVDSRLTSIVECIPW
jgi:hypothetical protein